MMKRTLMAILVSVAMASAASAATISAVIQGGNLLSSGSPVTVDLVANVSPPEAVLSLGLDVRLAGNGGLGWAAATQTNLTSFGGGLAWSTFATQCPGILPNPDQCLAVNQGNPVLPSGAQPDAFNGVIATATATAGAPGVYDLDVVIGDFFGAAATTQQYTIVPEPATVAFLGLGVFGLAIASRRR